MADEWWKFDNSDVRSVPESNIMALNGGGEADTAYRSMVRCESTDSSFAISGKGKKSV